MITPRATRLVRAENLPALQRALFRLATRGDLDAIRRRAIIVPSRAAAQHLRRTFEDLCFEQLRLDADAALALPELLTRHDWYQRMHERAAVDEPRLSGLEREVLLAAAAREAVDAGFTPPFRLRPGLIAEMLEFYDALRGQQRSVDTFERIVVEDLEPRTEVDRGAERLLRQTRFLVAAFRAFEARVAASGKLDEAGLRRRLIDDGPRDSGSGFAHVIVTVGDRTAEPSGGLYPADFELLMRAPGVDTIHVVATRQQLAAGLGERIRDLVPEIDEIDADDEGGAPVLVAPPGDESSLHFVARDREEELRSIGRRIKHHARGANGGLRLDRAAVVFKRPLPYVYLARTVFQSAGIAYQAADALPLASEPMAAVLDQVVNGVESRWARTSLTALLRSPHLAFDCEGSRPAPDDVEAFDRRLADLGYLGHAETLARLGAEWSGAGQAAARAAAAFVAELLPLGGRQPISAHTALLLSFLRSHERTDGGAESSRHLRARGAVMGALEELRLAALTFDDPLTSISDVAATLRRWIESQTFSPRLGEGGVHLVDAQAARYGTFETAHLAGLAEGDWPEPSSRNIFYPVFLLSQLGWPSEAARSAAARASFIDLLRLPAHRVSVSAFTLEDDSIVNPSPLIEELPRAGLSVQREDEVRALVFADEALSLTGSLPGEGLVDDGSTPDSQPVGDALSADTRRWFELRSSRTPAGSPIFHGGAGPGRGRTYTTTAIDRFLQCPFKYFAATILRLPEEIVDEPSRSPRAQGQFVHEVFLKFFESWQAAGGGTITADTMDAARSRFAGVVEEKLASLPAGDAGLERMRLLGSVGTPGLGEIVLAAEASCSTPVRERLLEYAFEGWFEIKAGDVTRRVRLRGQADRVDLLADGRFRVIDYKNGKLPEQSQTIQLPIYVVCLQQYMKRMRREHREVAEAAYIAFGAARPVHVVIDDGPGAAKKLADGQQRLLDAIDQIERGEFPPRPAAPRLCGTCAFASVCRKDVVDGH